MAERLPRKLAAILYADVVGYSRLMGVDESGTLARLKAHRREFIDPTIASYHGRMVKLMGDGALVEFASVVDALACAVDLQRGMTARNKDDAKEQRIEFRIGINLGDVIIDGDDIYGDGVNIAARLESLADHGGVCISESVRTAVGNRLPIGYEFMGEQDVKNIAEPVRAYKVALGSEEKTQLTSPAEPALELPDKPSIAVLPFTNMSGDPAQDSFCNGIAEDIVTALSRAPGLVVISALSVLNVRDQQIDPRQWAREHHARFVVEGSVRISGRRARVTAQLVDADTGRHHWSERYDRELGDVFAIQDEVTQRIVIQIRGELTEGEDIRVATRGTDNVEAADYVLRAWDLEKRAVQECNAEARRYAEKAIECDPDFSDAWNFLSWTHWHDAHFGWSDSREDSLRRAREAAEKASSLASNEDKFFVDVLMGTISLLEGDSDVAIELTRKAVSAHPRVCEHAGLLAMALLQSGHVQEGLAEAKRAVALSSAAPAWSHAVLGCGLHLAGELEEAIDILRRGVALEPQSPHCLAHLVAALAESGQRKEARSTAKELIALHPTFSVTTFGKSFPCESVRTRLTESWLAAGLPK